MSDPGLFKIIDDINRTMRQVSRLELEAMELYRELSRLREEVKKLNDRGSSEPIRGKA